MAREPNDADRWLLVRLPARDLIEAEYPTPQKWGWRYKGPADDPCGPTERAVDINKIVTWHSSLADLETLGWVWRGTRSSDFCTGWGLTHAGFAERARLVKSGQDARWRDNAEWWSQLSNYMADAMAANTPATK